MDAGWYRDPSGADAYRWWDGSAWTQHVHANTTASPALTQAAPAQTSLAPQPIASPLQVQSGATVTPFHPSAPAFQPQQTAPPVEAVPSVVSRPQVGTSPSWSGMCPTCERPVPPDVPCPFCTLTTPNPLSDEALAELRKSRTGWRGLFAKRPRTLLSAVAALLIAVPTGYTTFVLPPAGGPSGDVASASEPQVIESTQPTTPVGSREGFITQINNVCSSSVAKLKADPSYALIENRSSAPAGDDVTPAFTALQSAFSSIRDTTTGIPTPIADAEEIQSDFLDPLEGIITLVSGDLNQAKGYQETDNPGLAWGLLAQLDTDFDKVGAQRLAGFSNSYGLTECLKLPLGTPPSAQLLDPTVPAESAPPEEGIIQQ